MPHQPVDCWNLAAAELTQRRLKAVQVAPDMYQVVGMFMRWFGEVELQIDRNTMHILRMTDNFEPYGFMTYRTQFSQKWEMLRRVMIETAQQEERKGRIGPNLSGRLNFLSKHINPLRTNFAHKVLSSKDDRIYFCHTGAMLDPNPIAERPSRADPKHITLDEAMQVILWLEAFMYDLSELADSTWKKPPPQTYEIDRPRSYLPASALRWSLDD